MNGYCITEEYLYDYVLNNLTYHSRNMTIVMVDRFADIAENINAADEVCMVVATNRKLEKCVNLCHKIGIKEIKVLDLYAIDKRFPFVDKRGEFTEYFKDINLSKAYLVHMETHINDYCNLNCKACNNFAPWVKDKKKTSIESLSGDLLKLSKNFQLGRLFLLGGEPLLEQELVMKSVVECRNIFPTTEIRLLTNGVLIPDVKKELWDCLRENDVIVYITRYRPTMQKIDAITECLTKSGVKFIFGAIVNVFWKHWTRKPLEDADRNAEICGSAGCHFFGNGIYTKCPDAALIGFVGDVGKIGQKSIHMLDDIVDPWKACRELEKASDLCRYCSCTRGEAIEWSSAGNNPSLDDWFMEDKDVYLKKMKSKFKSFMQEKYKEDIDQCAIAIWGLGRVFDDNYPYLLEYLPICYIIDSRKEKAEQKSRELGIQALPLENINDVAHLFCIVTVENEKAFTEIGNYLSNHQIKFAQINEWRS